jgi:proteasome accessory factor C
MVPYFLANPGVSAADAARDLGTTAEQVMDDLNQLWMCGLPGYSPGDLIDLSFTEDSVEVTFSAGIDRPLKLTAAEAAPLLVALRSLIDASGVVDPAAARRAIAKIENAMGSPLGDTVTETPTADDAGESAAVVAVRDAVRRRQAVQLRYYSASRDEVTERVVDPVRIQAVEGRGYLEGWCRSSGGIRLFRFDRIDEASVLDEPARPPKTAETEQTLALFESDPTLPSAVIEIDPDVIWVLDYYLIEPVDEDGISGSDRPVVATMTYGSADWLTRFVLGFGGKIRVLNAPEISAEVQARAAATLGLYS